MSNPALSVPAVWSTLYHELKDTPWEDEDIETAVYGKNPEAHGAALTLRRVYRLAQDWLGVDAEEGVKATLKAAHRHRGGGAFLTCAEVMAAADAFAVHYTDYAEAADEYLEENAGDVRWDWLNDKGRKQVEEAIAKDSEIWLVEEPGLSGVWVFNKPGPS